MIDQSQLRIGDAEREAAATALGEHYATGRLTRSEYDERTDQVWAARIWADLDTLFADLPEPRVRPGPAARRENDVVARRDRPRRLPVGAVGLLLPLLVLAVVLFAAFGPGRSPWLLFVLGWLWFIGFPRRVRRLRRRE